MRFLVHETLTWSLGEFEGGNLSDRRNSSNDALFMKHPRNVLLHSTDEHWLTDLLLSTSLSHERFYERWMVGDGGGGEYWKLQSQY